MFPVAYLFLRYNKYSVRHDFPEDVWGKIGKRRQKSLKTSDKAEAEYLRALFEAECLAMIMTARDPNSKARDTTLPASDDPAFLNEAYRAADEEEREQLRSHIGERLREKLDRAARRAGLSERDVDLTDELPEAIEADRLMAAMTDLSVPFGEHIDDWMVSAVGTPKTKDEKHSAVKEFASVCPLVSDVTGRKVQEWVNKLATEYRPASIRKRLSALRTYWEYLRRIDVAPYDLLPFERIKVPRLAFDDDEGEKQAFQPNEIWRLIAAAEQKGDGVLADLFRLAMFTGARIEPLCSLRVEAVKFDEAYFTIQSDKTKSGKRDVPIHSKLLPTMQRLIGESQDGFVLPLGERNTKYKKRSGAIDKRANRLIRGLGFSKAYTFHSFRATVITRLMNVVGVEEAHVRAIVGHKGNGTTQRNYIKYVEMSVKRETLEKLDYPDFVSL